MINTQIVIFHLRFFSFHLRFSLKINACHLSLYHYFSEFTQVEQKKLHIYVKQHRIQARKMI